MLTFSAMSFSQKVLLFSGLFQLVGSLVALGLSLSCLFILKSPKSKPDLDYRCSGLDDSKNDSSPGKSSHNP